MSIMEPTKNKVSISDRPIAFNQSTASITSDYNLYFEIKSAMPWFGIIKSGSAQQSINKTDITNTVVNFANMKNGIFKSTMVSLFRINNELTNLKKQMIKMLIK